MHVILHQPEIPANTGNIGRTCVATGTSLDLIEPLGFQLNEKQLKRAGMDYWNQLDLHRYVNYDAFLQQHSGAKVWMATTKAKKSYTEVEFGPDDYIMFGKESAGVPGAVAQACDARLRLPIRSEVRSMNLAMTAGLALGEALRQVGGLPG